MTYKARVEISCFLGDALYAELTKRLELPFVPFVGLHIAFKLKKIGSGEEQVYKALATGCANSTGVVIVDSIVYYPEGSAKGDSLRVIGNPVAEKDEGAIAAYVKLMQMFYGFEAELLI